MNRKGTLDPGSVKAIEANLASMGDGDTTMGVPRKIMVVDDNFDSAQAMALLIGLEGHEVQTAYNGKDALLLAQAFRPEVMLVDLCMPGVDGYQVAQRLKDYPWGRQITLIALTGWGQPEDRQRAQSLGFSHYLVKPASPDEVFALINGLSRG